MKEKMEWHIIQEPSVKMKWNVHLLSARCPGTWDIPVSIATHVGYSLVEEGEMTNDKYSK